MSVFLVGKKSHFFKDWRWVGLLWSLYVWVSGRGCYRVHHSVGDFLVTVWVIQQITGSWDLLPVPGGDAPAAGRRAHERRLTLREKRWKCPWIKHQNGTWGWGGLHLTLHLKIPPAWPCSSRACRSWAGRKSWTSHPVSAGSCWWNRELRAAQCDRDPERKQSWQTLRTTPTLKTNNRFAAKPHEPSCLCGASRKQVLPLVERRNYFFF